MCDLRNIQKIFRGTTPAQRVCVGNRVIWPVEQYTYRVDEFRLDYSSDDRILRASAVNSVRIAATLFTTDRAGHTSSSTVYVSSPIARRGGEFYTVSSDGSISFNRREYGTTVVDPDVLDTPVYYGTFTDPNGRQWDSGDFEVPFEGNLEYTDILSASVSVSLDKSQVACNTTTVRATPSFSRTYKHRYTSTDETLPSTDSAGTASIYFCPSTDPLEDGSYIGDASNGQQITVSFDHYTNLNNDTSKFYAVRAAYSGKEARTQIEQLDDPRDSAIVTPVDGSYVVDVMAKSDDISARGGSARYGVLAHHEENVVIKYHFGGDTYYSGRRTAYDSVSYAISGTADAQSRYHNISLSGDIFSIGHYNMEKRGESADDITVAFRNESHTSATASVSFQPRNTKSTTAFAIVQPSTVSVLGGTVRITGTASYSWASGDSGSATVNADSVSNVRGTGFSASGGSIVVAHNKYTTGDPRSATFSAIYGGKTDTGGTISQYADSKTQDGSAVTHHYISASKAGDAIATESTIVFTIASTFMTEVHYKWASDGTDAGWQEIGRGNEGYNYHASGNGHTDSRYEYTKVSNTEFRVKHLNMQKRDTTDVDKLSLYFTNINDSLVKTTTYTFNPTNAKTPAHYGNTVGITVGLSRDYLDCWGGDVIVSGTRQREWYADAWASGAGGGMSYKYESITSWTSITVSPTATVSGTTITIGARKHNTSSQVFTVTGKADGKTATATVERLGDSTYPGTKYTRSHYLRVEGALNTISASGGSRKYDISAGHTLVTPTYWRSDDELYSEVTEQVRDKWKYTKSGAGQSYYKNFNVTAGTESSADYLSFDHYNMAKRVETDTISISIVNAFDATANPFTETLTPVNRLETSTPETTTAFEANNLVGIAAAGQSNIQIAGTRTFKTAYKKWTSGAEEGGATGYTAVNASSVSVNTTTYPWLHAVSGGKLTVDAYTATDADRTGVFSATYDGKTDSNVTVSQKAREKQPAEYISFYYEPQSQYLNYLYIKNNSDRAIDVNSFYYVMDGETTTSSALNMHVGESRLVRGWNPNVSHLTDYGVTDATWK